MHFELLEDNMVKNRHLEDGCVTPNKLAPSVKTNWLDPALDAMFNNRIMPLIRDLSTSDRNID